MIEALLIACVVVGYGGAVVLALIAVGIVALYLTGLWFERLFSNLPVWKDDWNE